MNFLRKKVLVPVWFLIFGAFSLVAALLNRLLFPSVRWFFRTRANNVITQVNHRLAIELPEFKLTTRKELIGRVVYDPQVAEAVADYCEETGVPRDVAMERVELYAREIVPSFNAYVYFRFGAWIANLMSRSFYRVRLGYADQNQLRDLKPNDSIMFVMNHRSNMDYVLLGLIAMDQTALSYAVGEWARVFPVQQIIKAMGGFFVRRGSGDKLYRKVLERYVQMATDAGVVQAMYPEGRLTRDGRLGDPKLGLLDYMLRTFDTNGKRDLILIPVAVNYDRVMEDRTQLMALDKKTKKPGLVGQVVETVKFITHNLYLMSQSKWYRFGYAVVNFGKPISTRAYAKEHGVSFHELTKEDRIQHAKDLANDLMDAIGEIVPVIPVAVVASVFARNPDQRFSAESLNQACEELIDHLEKHGAHIYVPRDSSDYSIEVGLRTLTLRHLVTEMDSHFRANPKELPLLNYYANSIAHLIDSADLQASINSHNGIIS